MSVSNDSAAGNGAEPEQKRDWPAIRREYESTTIARRPLAAKHHIAYGTLEKRAKREGWVQNAKLVKKTVAEVDARLEAKAKARVDRELAPWMEEQKVKFTKRGYKMASRGFDRAEQFMDANDIVDAKTEAYISKAAETYHRIGRVALGMGDGSAPAGSLNLNILTNQAAVQVVSQPS